MSTIPAAWYADPAGSGGLRWWDGAAWSEHVRTQEAPPAPAVATYEPVQQVQAPPTYQARSYQPAQQQFQAQSFQQTQPTAQPSMRPRSGVPPIPQYQPLQPQVYEQQAPVQSFAPTAEPEAYRPFGGAAAAVPSANDWHANTSYSSVAVDNKAGWTSLGFGVLGLAIVLVTSMSGTVVVVMYAPLIIAVGSGIRALAQRAAGTSSSLFTPIIGMACAVVAAIAFFVI